MSWRRRVAVALPVVLLAAVCVLLLRAVPGTPAPSDVAAVAPHAVPASSGDDPGDAGSRLRPSSPSASPPAETPPLPPDASVVLRLVDGSGAPVTGGRATAVRTDPQRFGGWVFGMRPEAPTLDPPASDAVASDLAASETEPGRVVLRALPPGAWLASVDAPGCAREVVRFVRAPDPEPLAVTVRMSRECVLRGRVLDSRGAPVAGIVVATDGLGERSEAPDVATRRDARTGADGAWRLVRLRPGRVRLWTWRDDQGWRSRALVAVPDVPSIDLVLPDGGTVTGIVRARATGLPVAGARVEAWSDAWENCAKFIGAAATDGEGRYLLDLRDWGGSFEILRVSAEGYADASVAPGGDRSASADPGEVVECDVTLDPECRLAGRVTGPSGPVVGATVRVWHPGTGPFQDWVAQSVRTSAEGAYILRGLSAGDVAVQVVAPGLRQLSVPPGRSMDPRVGYGAPVDAPVVTLDPAGETRFDVELAATEKLPTRLVITGTVRTAAGAPVAGAKVDVWSLDPVWTLRDGTFRVEADVPADFGATIYAYAGAAGTARGSEHGPYVEVARPETWRDVVLVVHARPSVRGRVRSAAGLPVAGARAVLGWRAEDKGGTAFAAWGDDHAATVAADGSFEIAIGGGEENGTYGVNSIRETPRGPSVVAVRAPGHAVGFSPVFEIADPPADAAVAVDVDVDVDVGIDAGHVLRGRVLDAAGDTPVAGATVSLSAGTSGGFRGGWPPTSLPDEWGWVAAVTGADGTFDVPGCGAGTWNVRAHAAGCEPDEAEIALPRAEPLTIRLRRTGRIAGRVLDPAGGPVGGADVQLVDPSRTGREARGPSRRTNADGTFAFPSVASAKWRLEVVPPTGRPEFAAASVEDVVPGATALVVQLPKALPISGRVVAADGSPIAEVEIECVREAGAGESEWTTSAADGTFLVGHLRAGRHGLRFHGLVVAVAGVEAGTADVVAKAAGALTVSGRVIGSTGEPAGDWTVTLRAPGVDRGDDFHVRRATSADDGSFAFRHLPEGEWDLALPLPADEEGAPRPDVTLRVRSGASGVELRFPRRGADGR